jgi:hypothetical protein
VEKYTNILVTTGHKINIDNVNKDLRFLSYIKYAPAHYKAPAKLSGFCKTVPLAPKEKVSCPHQRLRDSIIMSGEWYGSDDEEEDKEDEEDGKDNNGGKGTNNNDDNNDDGNNDDDDDDDDDNDNDDDEGNRNAGGGGGNKDDGNGGGKKINKANKDSGGKLQAKKRRSGVAATGTASKKPKTN